MPTPPLSREIMVETIAAVQQHGSITQAAKALEIPRETLQSRYRKAVIEAERGGFGTKPVIPSFRISQTTAVQDANGNLLREFIQQKPQRGEAFEVPAGQRIKGVSALVDSEGREIIKWIKTKEGELSSEAIIDSIKAAFEGFKGSYEPRPAPVDTDSDQMTVYSIVDWHIGLLAWAEETGENYDLAIAKKIILGAMARLIGSSPPSKYAVILGLGDLLHFDGFEPVTSRSGNFLDVDGRYPKVLRTAADMIISTIDMALQKHERVLVRMLPGNHDDRSTVALNLALDYKFDGHERVTVDASPSRIWWHRFGKVFLGATHGDKMKMNDLPLVMAADRPQDWASSTYRRIYTGHLHHERRLEDGGVIVTCMRTPVAKDAYHSWERYRSGRSVYSETFRRDGSEAATLQFNI